MEERRFTDEETRSILRLATDHDAPQARLTKGGFTLSELVSIGEEVGLDPAAVRRAAAVSPVQAGGARLVLGGAVRPVARAEVAGRLDRAQAAALATLCEAVFRRRGTTEAARGIWRWHEEHGPGRTSVEVRGRDGRSEVTVEADRQGWALLTALGSLAAAVVGLEAVGGVTGIAAALGLGAAVLAPLLLAGVLTRLVFPRLTRGLDRDVERVALAAVAAVEAAGSEPGAPSPPTPDGPPPAG